MNIMKHIFVSYPADSVGPTVIPAPDIISAYIHTKQKDLAVDEQAP